MEKIGEGDEEVRDRSTVRSIEKALKILRLFSYREGELSHSEISKRMGWTTSTTSRLLNTLVENQFLMKDAENGKYRLGSAVLYLGRVAAANADLRRISYPILLKLSDQTGETAHIYVRAGIYRTCYEQVESELAVRQVSAVGSKEPVWTGGTGTVLLAFLDAGEQEPVLAQIQREHPEVNQAALRERLLGARSRGYVERHGMDENQVGSVAAPIWNAEGKVEACLAVSMPSFRFPEDPKAIRDAVLEGALEISRQLGYMG